MIEKNKLLRAVLKRSVLQVQNCVIDGEDIFYKDEQGRNYLHISVYLRCNDLVKHFIDEGIDIHTTDHEEAAPIHLACRTGCESVLETLLEYGANYWQRAKSGITPFHIAAAFGHTSCLKLLYKYAATFKETVLQQYYMDDMGHMPIHYAASEGQVNATTYLVDKPFCHVDCENRRRATPLHFAAASGTPEVCHVLIEAKANINAENIMGQTPLHIATQIACVKTVSYLLGRHADPNIGDCDGNTCAHVAIKNGHTDLVCLLMDHGANPSLQNMSENTVIHLALKLGHFNLIPMMLPRASDLTTPDESGCSVIIEAIKNQLEELAIEMLKYCPALVHTSTHDLVTPLHLAAERGMTALTRQLLIAGAQVDAVDSSGLTPSLYCAKNDSVLECLAMIEDLMMVADNSIEDNNDQQKNQQSHIKGNGSKISSRISS